MNLKANYQKSLWWKIWAKKGLDIILPPRCPVNGSIVERVGAISPEAWRDLTFISDPKCDCCGVPFTIEVLLEEETSKTILCGDCLATPRPYDKARAIFTYDDGSRPMILAFKHGDKTHLHTTLAPLLAQKAEEFLTEETVLIPVPLHWLRLLKRRYNQAAVLTSAVAKILNRPAWNDALTRTRATPPQGHKKVKERHDNVAKAFVLNPAYSEKIKERNILLLDDVFTTGATVEECAKVLKAAGAKTVNVIAVARVVRDS